ncbi:MAG: AsmA-like C-terminal region-containing protein, partial [Desulfobacterales bacterium]
QTLGVEQGQVSVKETGSVAASLNAMLDKAPLSLTFEGGPKAPGGTWPLNLEASATGATIKGDGAVVTTENGKVLQIATHISGNRFESLGPLLGASLPAIGKFDLRADVSSDGAVHEADNLQVQIKNNRFTGSARWEDKAPRPVLSGKLSARRLTLSDFKTPSKTTSKNRRPGLLDRPIKLDALNAFDARLELSVKQVADSQMPVADISSTVTLTNGELNTPFRASITGTPVKGQIDLRQQNDISNVSFNATAEKIDAAQILKQLKMPEMVSGTIDAVALKASSTGKTLRALLEQAAFTLQLKPADLSYTFQIAGQTRDFTFSDVELAARRNEPLAAVFEGTLDGTPFNGDVSTANLREIQKSNSPLPLRVTVKEADLDFKAEGTIERPFKRNSFELQYELSGKEIQGLDPLADFAVPLRGEFSARGRITGRGNRFTYAEDLRVGKSDLRANITIVREPPRPKISGSITASQIHLDDINLVDADKEAAPAEDKPSRVIPDYTLPVEELLAVDLDADFRAERIRAPLGDLGEFVMKIRLKDGRFKSSTSVTGFKGARISSEFDLNAATQPPQSGLRINAKDLSFGYLLSSMDLTDIMEGNIDLYVDLSGAGATRYDFLGNVEGRITIIGGPGRMTGRRIDLWAADLIPTMLSTQWQREDVTETNCLVTHIELGEGRAEIEDLLLDTQRITVAASGILNLETEELDIVVAPRPKRASLVSLANPVQIQGTLAEPEISVTRIPRGRRLAGVGLLAGLVNPAFLIFALSDTGTGQANPCEAVVEQAREAAGISSPESQNTN